MENINNTSHEENLPNDKKDKLNIKLITITLSLLLFIGAFFSFTALSYKSFLTEFKGYFDNAHYKTATNYVVTKGNMNILKAVKLDSDLSSYFKDKLNAVAADINAKKISSDDALVIVNEINRYNLLDSEIDNVVSVLSKNASTAVSSDTNTDNDAEKKDTASTSGTSSNGLTLAITQFNQGNFKDALENFKTISSTHEGYETALNYIPKCKESLTKALMTEVDSLVAEHYYSKSIDLLESNLTILDNSDQLIKKITELKSAREEYIKERDNK